MSADEAQPWFHLGCEDAIGSLRRLEDGSVDLVVTDPPYESLEKHRAIGTTTRLKHSRASSNDWFSIFPNARFAELFAELHRVLRRDRHFYLFSDPETAFVAKPLIEAAGFKFWKPLVWDKKRIGMGYHYRARYELVLFSEKGKRRLANLGIPDILEVPRIHRGLPAEKPVALSEILIRQSTAPGEVVCDPFCGSGSVGVAALSLGRSFIGNDLSVEAVERARGRLLDTGYPEREDLGPIETGHPEREDLGPIEMGHPEREDLGPSSRPSAASPSRSDAAPGTRRPSSRGRAHATRSSSKRSKP